MKKINSLLIVLLFIGPISFAQGPFLGFGIIYQNHNRPQFDNYLNYFTNAVDLPEFKVPNAYGLDLYIGSKIKHTDYMLGASYCIGSNASKSLDKSREITFTQNIFDLHLGFDRYLTRWFFVGGQLNVSSFSGKTRYKNTGTATAADTSIDFTKDSWNIFKGYSLGLRGESGFFIPFKSQGSGLKLLGYYDLGLSKYDFYNSFDKVLTTYPGDKKTRGNKFGIQLMFLISMSGK